MSKTILIFCKSCFNEQILKNDWTSQSFLIYLNHEKSLQALSKYGKMETVELEKEINYEIS